MILDFHDGLHMVCQVVDRDTQIVDRDTFPQQINFFYDFRAHFWIYLLTLLEPSRKRMHKVCVKSYQLSWGKLFAQWKIHVFKELVHL